MSIDIADWLRNLGLGQYETAFRDNEIDERVLPGLTADDLKDLGVTLVGHRRRLLDAIATLGEPRSQLAPSEPVASPPPMFGAERRQLTVLFCDLVGSTALSARLDPEDLSEVIAAYHAAVREEVGRVGGYVAKYMGDGVLVYFGYPEAHENDAERAVRAGLALIDAVAVLGTSEHLQVRLGIANGLVVVGDLIGEGEAQERAVVGETPNLAARLQGLAQAGTLVIGDNTRRQIGGLFELEDLGPQSLIGFAEPQRAWRVLGESGVVSRFEALRSTAVPLVGRDEEMQLLLRRWRQAKEGEGRAVLISGEPGIGKSRLAAALVERLTKEPHTRLHYSCSPHHEDSALYPFIVQLERAAGFARDDTSEQKLDKLEALFAAGLRDPDELTLIAELLSLPNAAAELNLRPQKKREKLFEALLGQLTVITRSTPVLMVFEDAHWIDPMSHELLDLTIDRVRRLPVLLLVTFRTEFQPSWAGQPHVTTSVLNRLGGQDVVALVQNLVGDATLGADVVAEIVGRTDGIPLFVEELTKAVLESADGENAVAAVLATSPTATLAIPATLHASLIARLDRLGTAAKEVAQVGAVLGREFGYELIDRVADRADLDTALGQLSAAGLLFCRGVPPQASYLFKHALVQDAAYATLLRRRRQELHGHAAKVLQEHFADLVERQPELLAHNYSEAGNAKGAIKWWRKAGQQAIQRSGNAEAVADFNRALKLIETLSGGRERDLGELETRIQLGTALFATKGAAAKELVESYARAWTLCEQIGSAEHAFAVLWGQYLSGAAGRGVMPAQIKRAKQFLQLAEQQADEGMQVIGHRRLGACLVTVSDFITGRYHLERALALYDPLKHHEHTFTFFINPAISCLATLSLTLQYLGYPDQAAHFGERAVEEATQLGHFNTLGVALHLVGRFRAFRREHEQLHVVATDLLALAREQGSAEWELVGEILLGWRQALTGELEQGLRRVQRGTGGLRARNRHHLHLPAYLLFEAELLAKAGRLEDELQLLDEAHLIMETQGQPVCEAELYRLRAWALQAQGASIEEVESCFSRSLEIARRQSAKFWELRSAVSCARFWRNQRRCQEARDLLTPVYSWFTEGFDTGDLKDAKALLEALDS
jgi:class 3 adenylate cyclase/tetratricopeptide (TPR) repeat protein